MKKCCILNLYGLYYEDSDGIIHKLSDLAPDIMEFSIEILNILGDLDCCNEKNLSKRIDDLEKNYAPGYRYLLEVPIYVEDNKKGKYYIGKYAPTNEKVLVDEDVLKVKYLYDIDQKFDEVLNYIKEDNPEILEKIFSKHEQIEINKKKR